jgi:hypothetical protein
MVIEVVILTVSLLPMLIVPLQVSVLVPTFHEHPENGLPANPLGNV